MKLVQRSRSFFNTAYQAALGWTCMSWRSSPWTRRSNSSVVVLNSPEFRRTQGPAERNSGDVVLKSAGSAKLKPAQREPQHSPPGGSVPGHRAGGEADRRAA